MLGLRVHCLPLLVAAPVLSCAASAGPPASAPAPDPLRLAPVSPDEPRAQAPKNASVSWPILLLKDGHLLSYTSESLAPLFDLSVEEALLSRDGRWLLYVDDEPCARLYDVRTRRHYDPGVCAEEVRLIGWAPDSSRVLMMLSTGHWVLVTAETRVVVDLGPLPESRPEIGRLDFVGFHPDARSLLFEDGLGCEIRAFSVPVSGGELKTIEAPACRVDPETGSSLRERYGIGGRIESVYDEATETNWVYELAPGQSLEATRRRSPLFRSSAPRASGARVGRFQVSPSGELIAHQALRFHEVDLEPDANGRRTSKGGHPVFTVEMGRVGEQLRTVANCGGGECAFWWVDEVTLAIDNGQRVVLVSHDNVRSIAENASLVTPEKPLN